VSSQNNSYWSAEDRIVVHEVTLYDAKFGVWCAISSAIITRHIFSETINSRRYFTHILKMDLGLILPQYSHILIHQTAFH
jgi:hypothetical protein